MSRRGQLRKLIHEQRADKREVRPQRPDRSKRKRGLKGTTVAPKSLAARIIMQAGEVKMTTRYEKILPHIQDAQTIAAQRLRPARPRESKLTRANLAGSGERPDQNQSPSDPRDLDTRERATAD